MQDTVTLISQLGFPIFVCIYLFWDRTKEREEHRAETKALSDALNNNTLALQRLADKIGGDIIG